MMRLTRTQRAILIAFGVLDGLLFLRFAPQILWPSSLFEESLPLSLVALFICRSLVLISLGVSAIGLVTMRKWAIILSYVQFPIRFGFGFLSFGFLAYLAKLPDFPVSYPVLMIIAMVLEGVRLSVTIAIHRRAKHGPQLNRDPGGSVEESKAVLSDA